MKPGVLFYIFVDVFSVFVLENLVLYFHWFSRIIPSVIRVSAMRLKAMWMLSVSCIVIDWNMICGMNSRECSRNTANPAEMYNSLVVFIRK